MSEDMEICCDSLALSYIKDVEVKEYGFTIINLIDRISIPERFSKSVGLVGTTYITNNKSEVRRRILMIKLFNKKAYRLSALALVVLLIVGGVALSNAKVSPFNNSKAIIVDKIDFPFVYDPQIVGKWQAVDIVEKIENFSIASKNFKGNLEIKELNFTNDGKVPETPYTWTKNHLLDTNDKTDGKYTIKEIDGSKYMFLEWKNGDYTNSGTIPGYYVLKQVK